MTKEDRIAQKAGWTQNRVKRFYKTVTVAEAEGGHTVLLDGRTVKTPLKRAFAVPTPGLADAIGGEWLAQDEYVVPGSMPLLKLANTAIDHAGDKFAAIVDEFVSFAGSDLLCYRAETPDGLVARQEALWDPLLTWAARELGAGFVVTRGIVHQSQPEAVLTAIRTWADGRDRFSMTALQGVTALTGSAVLAMALMEEHMPAGQAWDAANVDEDWQIELWGRDEEAERVRAGRRREFEAAAQFLHLLKG
ncbi:MAG: ATP12 family chaperone protein [Hyphomicrobiales bacterium]